MFVDYVLPSHYRKYSHKNGVVPWEVDMLDMVGTVLVGAAMAAILSSFGSTMRLRLPVQLTMAGVAGAWVGLTSTLAGAGGALSNAPTLLTMLVTPIVVTVVLSLAFPTVRRALNAIPLPLLVGLHVIRLGGVFFVLLAIAGRLSGPFPYIAGWGDFATGALAIPVAWLATRETNLRDRLVIAWNIFGMLDLIVAVSLGVISGNGSPVQLIHAGIGSAAMQTLPWAFIPTVLVPFFLIDHGIVFARMRARAMDRLAQIDRRGQPVDLDRNLGHAH
jgi:hypothetical protein